MGLQDRRLSYHEELWRSVLVDPERQQGIVLSTVGQALMSW